jgi:hypothetical protein
MCPDSCMLRAAGPGDEAELELTAAGIATRAQVRDGIARNTARVHAGIDAGDLATTCRVLEEVTARARATLAN